MLTADNWASNVLKSKNLFIIEYFSSKCGSCKEFSKTWDKLIPSIDKEFRVARVNIDSKAGTKLAKEQGVLKLGIPAVQIVAGNHGSVIMAGQADSLLTLQSKIKESAVKFHATKNIDTGFWQHSDFFIEAKPEL
jgi:hypothetical protein